MDNEYHHVEADTLIAENIFLTIGQKDILRGATIRAVRGTITGLLGRNGAGKSTMLQAIFGTLRAQECDVFVNGRKKRKPFLQNGLVNYLPQKPFLPGNLSVKQIAKQFGVDHQAIPEVFPELEQELGKKVNDLSGGTERLLSVLVLLMADTRFTLLDEPFSHIMPLHVERLKSLLELYKARKGIIITDHLYAQLLDASDSIYLMKEGRSIFIKDNSDLILHGYLGEWVEV